MEQTIVPVELSNSTIQKDKQLLSPDDGPPSSTSNKDSQQPWVVPTPKHKKRAS